MSADTIAVTSARRSGRSLGALRVVLWVFCLLFVVMPLGAIAVYGIFSWRGAEVLNGEVLQAAINSAVSSLSAAVIATVVALALAIFVEHTDLPGRGALRMILLTPLLVPPFIGAIAWTGVFGPASPINMQWTQWFGHTLWNLYGADGVICGIVGMAIGSLASRSRKRSDHALGSIALLPQSVPGLIIAVGWLLLAPHVGLFNTPWVILAAYVTAFIGLVVQTVEAPLKAIPDALVDAARISGASPLTAMRDVIWRMGASAAVTGAAMVVLTAVRELTISSLLLAPDAQTLGVVIFGLQQSGAYNAAAALSLLITVIGLAALRMVTRAMRGR